MVVAQGLGDADRQAPGDEKGDRGAGATAGRDHASHLGGWHRVPVDPGRSRSRMRAKTETTPIGGNSSSTAWWNGVPRGTMDEVSSHVGLDLPSSDGKADQKIVPPRPRIP